MIESNLGKDDRSFGRQTYRLIEVAALFGISRNQAYECAKRGDFPTIKLGKRLVVPRAAIDRMLGIGGEAALPPSRAA
jgi:predicted DNA-binding transcriptional regulator AlpA